MIGFIELLQLVSTSKDYALTVLHTSQITAGHSKPSQSATVFTNRCLIAVSNAGRSPTCGFPKCSRPQLPANNSPLTHSLTHPITISHSPLTHPITISNSLTNSPITISHSPLTCPACNISAGASHKTPFLCCSAIVAVKTCLFEEPLLSKCCCIVA
jgi:hypothetical protein